MTGVPFKEYMGLSDAEYADFQASAREAGMSEREFFDTMMKHFTEHHPPRERGIDIKDYIVSQEVLDDQERAAAVVRKHLGKDDDDDSPY